MRNNKRDWKTCLLPPRTWMRKLPKASSNALSLPSAIQSDPKEKSKMPTMVDSNSAGVMVTLTELSTKGQTLKRMMTGVPTYFGSWGTSNEPAEANNGRLEHFSGASLKFRTLSNHVARSLLKSGG